MNIYDFIQTGLDIFSDNLYLGHENIKITFPVEGAVTGSDRFGNPMHATTNVIVEGRATSASITEGSQTLPGTGNIYLSLKINVTQIDGDAARDLPQTIRPKLAGTAVYTQSNGTTMEGEFRVEPYLSKSVSKIHQKIGDIIYGTLEVSGDG